ncbi:MAG: metallopeptidase family protein [Parvularculaceae bacterium]
MTANWDGCRAPGIDDFDAMARATFEAMPAPFRALCGDLIIHIADFADEDILADLGIEDAFELTGLYEGTDIASRSLDDIARAPSHVHLYRQPILAEWIDDGGVALDALIRHVLVHEIGHHFGLSDDDIHRIENEG